MPDRVTLPRLGIIGFQILRLRFTETSYESYMSIAWQFACGVGLSFHFFHLSPFRLQGRTDDKDEMANQIGGSLDQNSGVYLQVTILLVWAMI